MSKNSYIKLPSEPVRPLLWVGSSKKDYLDFPERVIKGFGFELHAAQAGLRPPSAKLLKGLGSGIIEIIGDYEGDAFRAVYTVRFRDAVYVLHAFKKKSRRGTETPKSDIDLIRRRLNDAALDHAQRFGSEKTR